MFHKDKPAPLFSQSLGLALLLLLSACGDSLNSLDGPSTGMVSGLVCQDLPMLTAALELPASEDMLVSQGKCLNLVRSEQVKIVRTVMMPGDGQYSQFELASKGNRKMWIQTSKVRAVQS